MTDTPEPGVTMTDAFNDYLAKEAARDCLRAELFPANKAAIFDALVLAGIATVVVAFDGYGDSGQIESIDAKDAAGEVAVPDMPVATGSPSYAGDDIDRQSQPLAEAIEEMAYDLLAATHCGWENNDGAYGEFTFDVAARTISLDFNGRYTAVDSYSYDF